MPRPGVASPILVGYVDPANGYFFPWIGWEIPH